MKGVQLASNTAVMIIMVLIVLAIILSIASYINSAQAQVSVEATVIMKGCKEWQQLYGCEREKAALVKIPVKNAPETNLAALCVQRYGGTFAEGQPAYEACRKTLCVGCPVDKTSTS
jgi:hypothetical protein